MFRRFPGTLILKTWAALSAIVLSAALAACAGGAKTPAMTGKPPDTGPAAQPAGGDAWNKVVLAAAKEGTLTIYSFNFGGESGLKLAEAFQKKYRVKLEIVTGRGAEFVERLKTERRLGQRTADVSEGSITNLLQMKAEGFTAPLNPNNALGIERRFWQPSGAFRGG